MSITIMIINACERLPLCEKETRSDERVSGWHAA